ncbi:fatty acid desaturase [bacterium]|nr:fatty acid desaturase [bacterium]
MNILELQQQIRDYTTPSLKKAFFQLADSLLPYLALWALMILSVSFGFPYWVTLSLALFATVFQIRLFIIFHDCCHQSFFASQKANRILGHFLGILTFTPYDGWAEEHLTHHASVADLDRRGTGDIWTMTVKEYKAATPWRRFLYRMVRHPFNLFAIGPIWVFFIFHRIFQKGMSHREKISVVINNLGILAIFAAISLTLGWKAYLMIQLPLIYLSGALGIWLFYVQHQFDPTHWYPHAEWDYLTAALHSSSYYKLPKVLQWITGNIGLHHVHHVNARIPNYHLQPCLDNTPFLQQVEPMTLLKSFKTVKMNLWDEEKDKLVSFKAIRQSS